MKKSMAIMIICLGLFLILIFLYPHYASMVKLADIWPVDKEKMSLNPYVGYTMNPDVNKRINLLGFDGPLITKDKDIYSVGIFGGSVAYLYTYAEKERLVQELSHIPVLKGKDIRVYNFSLPGYKQPQQLMTLTYLLSLGYKPDMIINIDGFNEAVLSYVTNYKNGVSSYYPWNWYLYSRKALNTDILTLVKSIEDIRKIQYSMISLPWKLGSIPNAIILRLSFLKQIELTKKLRELDGTYQTKGGEPSMNRTEKQEIEEIIDIWHNSAVQMNAIAKANNILYFEFLHPNQYISNSKPFSTIEKEKYIKWSHPYANAARDIYPQIIAKTQELKDEGVALYDLTRAFSHLEETIYFDDCCHYVRKGYSLLTVSIMTAIKEYLN